MNSEKHRLSGREVTSRRLKLQVVVFAVVFVLITTVAIVRIVQDRLEPLWPLAGFALGLVIGALLVRSRSLGWDAADHQVVSSLSIGGIIVTIVYFVFMALRDRLIGAVVDDATTVAVAGMTITGGVMLGRVLVTIRSIRRTLTEAGVVTRSR